MRYSWTLLTLLFTWLTLAHSRSITELVNYSPPAGSYPNGDTGTDTQDGTDDGTEENTDPAVDSISHPVGYGTLSSDKEDGDDDDEAEQPLSYISLNSLQKARMGYCTSNQFMPDPRSLTRFLWCVHGVYTIMECPPGTIYCHYQQTCCGPQTAGPSGYKQFLLAQHKGYGEQEPDETSEEPAGYGKVSGGYGDSKNDTNKNSTQSYGDEDTTSNQDEDEETTTEDAADGGDDAEVLQRAAALGGESLNDEATEEDASVSDENNDEEDEEEETPQEVQDEQVSNEEVEEFSQEEAGTPQEMPAPGSPAIPIMPAAIPIMPADIPVMPNDIRPGQAMATTQVPSVEVFNPTSVPAVMSMEEAMNMMKKMSEETAAQKANTGSHSHKVPQTRSVAQSPIGGGTPMMMLTRNENGLPVMMLITSEQALEIMRNRNSKAVPMVMTDGNGQAMPMIVGQSQGQPPVASVGESPSPESNAEMPLLNAEIPMIGDEMPVLNSNMPGMNGESPMMNGDMPIMNGDMPMTNGDMTMRNRERAMMSGEMPMMNGKISMINGEMPMINREMPMMNGEMLMMNGEMPMLNGEMPMLNAEMLAMGGGMPMMAEQGVEIVPMMDNDEMMKMMESMMPMMVDPSGVPMMAAPVDSVIQMMGDGAMGIMGVSAGQPKSIEKDQDDSGLAVAMMGSDTIQNVPLMGSQTMNTVPIVGGPRMADIVMQQQSAQSSETGEEAEDEEESVSRDTFDAGVDPLEGFVRDRETEELLLQGVMGSKQVEEQQQEQQQEQQGDEEEESNIVVEAPRLRTNRPPRQRQSQRQTQLAGRVFQVDDYDDTDETNSNGISGRRSVNINIILEGKKKKK